MRVAVIDLGTNTCNLLIADIGMHGCEILHQSKQLVKLGDGQINNNYISSESEERVIRCFQTFGKTIEKMKAEKVRVVSTSAVRGAENKIAFLDKLGNQTGWVIKVVSGDQEARLIFGGILLAMNNLEAPAMVLDIGGGSNELILAHRDKIVWKESKPTGMARVINQFALSNPLRYEELLILQNFFNMRHSIAINECNNKGVKTLIGCAGAFDTLADLIDKVNPGEKHRKSQLISLSDFNRIYRILLHSTHQQRLRMKGMDWMRVDLIVPAMVFIHQLIVKIGITQIIQTDYSLREGVLYEMMGGRV